MRLLLAAPATLPLLIIKNVTGGFQDSLAPKGVIFLVCIYAAAFMIVAFLFLRLGRRGNPNASNTCAKCGYDFRATPERCPECGTVPLRQ